MSQVVQQVDENPAAPGSVLRSIGRRLRIKFRGAVQEPLSEEMLESLEELDWRERFQGLTRFKDAAPRA